MSPDYTPYQRDILLLYKWGILSGMDHSGSFLPDEPIQRCQVAAMVTRLAYEHLRITLNWDLSLAYSCSDATWGGSGHKRRHLLHRPGPRRQRRH